MPNSIKSHPCKFCWGRIFRFPSFLAIQSSWSWWPFFKSLALFYDSTKRWMDSQAQRPFYYYWWTSCIFQFPHHEDTSSLQHSPLPCFIFTTILWGRSGWEYVTGPKSTSKLLWQTGDLNLIKYWCISVSVCCFIASSSRTLVFYSFDLLSLFVWLLNVWRVRGKCIERMPYLEVYYIF